jgi:tetratricopeptide (TPR) repeat protein
MKRVVAFLSVALCFGLIVPAAGSQVDVAEAEFTAGMLANGKGDPDLALQHLQRAVDLNPEMTKAHFAIGAIVDVWCGMNEERCRLAISAYRKVLDLDPSYPDGLKNIGWAIYAAQRPNVDEAEIYYRKALAADPKDPELICAVAAIDAQGSWHDLAIAKADLKLPMRKLLIPSSSCHEVRERNLARVEEGIALLMGALQIRKDSTELLGFLSWLYMDRAEIQCDNRQAYMADENAARKWDRLRKEVWKRKADTGPFQKCPPAPPPMPK